MSENVRMLTFISVSVAFSEYLSDKIIRPRTESTSMRRVDLLQIIFVENRPWIHGDHSLIIHGLNLKLK